MKSVRSRYPKRAYHLLLRSSQSVVVGRVEEEEGIARCKRCVFPEVALRSAKVLPKSCAGRVCREVRNVWFGGLGRGGRKGCFEPEIE